MLLDQFDYHVCYYRLQFACQACWWGLVYGLSGGRWVYELGDASVATSPAWLVGPPQHSVGNLMVWLHARRRTVYLAMPYMLGVAAFGDNARYFFPRYVAALAVSVYHAAETALSRRHGEYGLLYSAWGCCLPAAWARGACLGAATHFVLSAGAAKVRVGGLGWCRGSTLRTYLKAYRESKSALTRPFSPALSSFVATYLAAPAAVATLLLECVAAPAALFLAPPYRAHVTTALVLMHVGIFLAMSAQVGLAFVTALPVYVLGFCGGPLDRGPRLLAALVGLGPTAWSLGAGRSIPETWPLSPCALFMFDGPQADALAAKTMTGATRLVLAPRDFDETTLVGATVCYAFKPRAPSTAAVVHDAVLRTLGFTLCPSEEVLRLLSDPAWDPAALVAATEAWLRRERTLAETTTGRKLARAFFVEVDDAGTAVARRLA